MNGVATDYLLDDDKIVSQIYNNQQIWFDYDAAGTRHAMEYNGNNYYYYYNLQGDVIGLYDSNLNSVVQYTYDSWGKLLSVTGSLAETVGKANPFRYRGYYYDSETELYYVSSRYYDPENGRWISPEPNVDYGEFDEGSEMLGYNVYTYCFNNPVNNFDPDGEAVANIVCGVIVGVAGAALGYLLADRLGLKGWKKWALISAATVGGAVLGAFLGPYIAKLGGKVVAKLGGKVAAKLGIRTATKTAFKSIGKISARKMSHINVPKHLWERVLKKVTNNAINNLIKQAVKKGSWETLKGGVSKITYCYSGEIITVTGKIINGVFNVGDAWVNR